jgi:hypothetical protein
VYLEHCLPFYSIDLYQYLSHHAGNMLQDLQLLQQRSLISPDAPISHAAFVQMPHHLLCFLLFAVHRRRHAQGLQLLQQLSQSRNSMAIHLAAVPVHRRRHSQGLQLLSQGPNSMASHLRH